MCISQLRFKSQSQHIFFFASLMFSKVKATAFVGSETDRFFIVFFLHDHFCSTESRCKLQRMKNGFHQNALFTIPLQTKVSLR